jgi:hypothetical protein
MKNQKRMNFVKADSSFLFTAWLLELTIKILIISDFVFKKLKLSSS